MGDLRVSPSGNVSKRTLSARFILPPSPKRAVFRPVPLFGAGLFLQASRGRFPLIWRKGVHRPIRRETWDRTETLCLRPAFFPAFFPAFRSESPRNQRPNARSSGSRSPGPRERRRRTRRPSARCGRSPAAAGRGLGAALPGLGVEGRKDRQGFHPRLGVGADRLVGVTTRAVRSCTTS
jgi:hypothetical protein